MDENIKIPTHVVIIMDGNRRWAKDRGLTTRDGHKAGAQALEDISKFCNKIGIKYLTVYAFSTENWKRSEEEVSTLMNLMLNYLESYSKRADSENIKVKILGNRQGLSEKMVELIDKCMERTKNNTGVTFNIALNYGGRDEIVKAIKSISEKVKKDEREIEDINEELLLLLKSYGVNRLSIGIESFDENKLKFMERKADFKDAEAKIKLCRKWRSRK